MEVTSADELEMREAFKQALLHVRFLVVRDNDTQELRQSVYSGECRGLHAA